MKLSHLVILTVGTTVSCAPKAPGIDAPTAASSTPAPASTIPPSHTRGGWVILQRPVDTEVFGGCLRPPFNPIGVSFWQPSEADVRSAEAAIEQTVATRYGRRLSSYVRQYMGVVVNGINLTYLIATHVDGLELVERFRRDFDWRTTVVNACGGGSLYFRATYDAKTGNVALVENAPR